MTIGVTWTESDDVCRCSLQGELDLASEPRVRKALFQALAQRPRIMTIDLSGVSFIDSTGLRVLLSCRNRADTTGTRVVLAGVGPAVARTLDIANLRTFFEFSSVDPN